MQNTQGSANRETLGPSTADDIGTSLTSMGYVDTALYLYRKFGLGIFFDGIQPKLYRAAVNHSVTFYVYDLIMRSIHTS